MIFLEKHLRGFNEYEYPREVIKAVEVEESDVSIHIVTLDENCEIELEHYILEEYENHAQAMNRTNEIKAFRNGVDSIAVKLEKKLNLEYDRKNINKFNGKWLLLMYLQPFLVIAYISIFILSFFSTFFDDLWMNYKYPLLIIITLFLYFAIYLMDKFNNIDEKVRYEHWRNEKIMNLSREDNKTE